MIENDENPQSWPPIPQGKSQSKAIDRAQRKTQPLNFQDYFLQICTFKIYGSDCGHGSTLLHATPTFRNRSMTYGAPCMFLFLQTLFHVKILPSFLMVKIDLKRNENQQHRILYCSNLSVEASFLCKRSNVSLNAPLDWLSFSANRSLSCLSLLFSSSIATMDGFPLPVN